MLREDVRRAFAKLRYKVIIGLHRGEGGFSQVAASLYYNNTFYFKKGSRLGTITNLQTFGCGFHL